MALKLTLREVEQLTCGETFNNRFEIIHNDIPLPIAGEKWHSSDYIEDDGRQYRYIEFTDKTTGLSYNFPYTYNPEYENFFDQGDLNKSNIVIVKESIIDPPKPEPEPEPVVLTSEEQALQDLKDQYEAIKNEVVEFDPKTTEIPNDAINDVLSFLVSSKFSFNDLISKIYPICIQYKTDQRSFWQFLQRKRGAWK